MGKTFKSANAILSAVFFVLYVQKLTLNEDGTKKKQQPFYTIVRDVNNWNLRGTEC